VKREKRVSHRPWVASQKNQPLPEKPVLKKITKKKGGETAVKKNYAYLRLGKRAQVGAGAIMGKERCCTPIPTNGISSGKEVQERTKGKFQRRKGRNPVNRKERKPLTREREKQGEKIWTIKNVCRTKCANKANMTRGNINNR